MGGYRERRRRISVRAQQRARQIADRMAHLPERLQWEQHRDDLVLVLLDEIDFDDE